MFLLSSPTRIRPQRFHTTSSRTCCANSSAIRDSSLPTRWTWAELPCATRREKRRCARLWRGGGVGLLAAGAGAGVGRRRGGRRGGGDSKNLPLARRGGGFCAKKRGGGGENPAPGGRHPQ